MRFLLFTVYILGIYTLRVNAQNITHADGSALITSYCYDDINYQLIGTPAGGVFSGCGIFQEQGMWYFNPFIASMQETVFPFSCGITYTINSQVLTRNLLIQKPVSIYPTLQDTGTCSGNFFLHAQTLYAGQYNYEWIPATPLLRADTSHTEGHIASTQIFVLIAEDVMSGCTGSDTVLVTKYPIPEVKASPDTIHIIAREAVELKAEGAEHYTWFPRKWLNSDTIAQPIAYPQQPIQYWVLGSNEFGCTDTAHVQINIAEDMMVPNAFSPNGDGLNDIFRVENIGYQGIQAFRVFNRWGMLVFQSLDGTKGWDGNHNETAADVGTYYYYIELGMLDGSVKIFKGEILLIR